MKVLTKNVKLQFECSNVDKYRCPSPQTKDVQVSVVVDSGRPVCTTCNRTMKLNDECLVIN